MSSKFTITREDTCDNEANALLTKTSFESYLDDRSTEPGFISGSVNKDGLVVTVNIHYEEVV